MRGTYHGFMYCCKIGGCCQGIAPCRHRHSLSREQSRLSGRNFLAEVTAPSRRGLGDMFMKACTRRRQFSAFWCHFMQMYMTPLVSKVSRCRILRKRCVINLPVVSKSARATPKVRFAMDSNSSIETWNTPGGARTRILKWIARLSA